MNLCRRCYIKEYDLKKKEIKQLISTSDKFKCDVCGEYKSIIIEPKEQIKYYDDEDYN